MSKVLLFSKTKNRARAISKDLESAGCEVVMTADLSPPSALLAAEAVDVILIDLLSGTNGVGRTVEMIKDNHWLEEMPVVALISKDDVESIKAVVEINEVIIYPCNPTEMSLRLQLALRARPEDEEEGIIKIEGLVINPISYEITVDGSLVSLTYKEFELLKFLAKNSGKVYARQTLVKEVWNHDYSNGMRTVDVHIRRLRAKLGRYSSLIATVRNVGYRFGNPVSSAV